MGEPVEIRRAGAADAGKIGRLLHAFNLEYDEPTPGAEALAARAGELLRSGEMTVLLAGEPPVALAVLRVRPALWTDREEAYLQELYVTPTRRREGIGEALMMATMAAAREAGATTIDLNTGETDVGARGLYEKLGFTNLEDGPGGPAMIYYEREL